jgi:hypothetical protein
MTVNTQLLISNVVHGTPSGNYDGSSQDWVSDAAKAAAYYRGRGGVQTMFYNLSGFVGEIHIEATLDFDPDTANWVEVDVYGDSSTEITSYHSSTVTGNFTWLRARVQGFDSGTINTVSVTY